jgi:hypothetical protein
MSPSAQMRPRSFSGRRLCGERGVTFEVGIRPGAPRPHASFGRLPHRGRIRVSVGTRHEQGSKLTANLRPVAGATGSGTATVTIRLGKGELCFTLTVTGLTNVTAAHIHGGSTGAIVVPLTAPTSGTSSGCVDVAKSLLQEILSSPAAFYVNVHTTSFPNGQIRGDLSK